ncbi:unnamed protein product [Ectocarpus sp. CCAP 1310/34]|nr:unnamed protein product [Ectocarpus sp. CCAP 1310/34]
MGRSWKVELTGGVFFVAARGKGADGNKSGDIRVCRNLITTGLSSTSFQPNPRLLRVYPWNGDHRTPPSQFVMSSEDRAALVALFWSTGGTRWIFNANWATDANLSKWHGVEVNDHGRVVELDLNNNNLRGTVPETLRGLKELMVLNLSSNKLTGFIPAWLGSLNYLQTLGLHSNQLAGPIPEELGALKELTELYLYNNKLTGPIPEALGTLKEVRHLCLDGNNLTGPVPNAVGNLENLRELHLQNNRLTGVIPAELANLSALSKFRFRNAGWKALFRRGNKLAGGPAHGERLDLWRDRMWRNHETKPQTLEVVQTGEAPVTPPPFLLPQPKDINEGEKKEEDAPLPSPPTPPVLLPQQQEPSEGEIKEENAPVPSPSAPPALLAQQQETGGGDENEEDVPLPLGSPNQREEVVREGVRSPEHASLSPEKAEEVDRLFRVQLSSSAGFDSLIRENPEALEDIHRVIKAPAAGSLDFVDEISDMERRRKLGTLVNMAKALGEVALSHTEDMDVQRKELALTPFSKAYYTAVRSGLCNAYLAASVIDSDWVSTCKTGGMGKGGTALVLLSSAVPVISGLAGLAGKALRTGDHCLQTRRLVKITAMAADTMECCSLARRLALQLTDGLKDDTGMMDDEADQVYTHITAGMNGGSGSGRDADISPDDMIEDDVFEYLLEEVARYERSDHGGKRLGKKHLRKLLKAIQRGCLDGSSGIKQKMEALLLEILPGADIRTSETSSTPKKVIVRSPPALAPTHDGRLPSMADIAALQAAVEVLTLAKDKQRAELEVMRSAQATHQAELEALKSDKEEQQAELAALNSAMEKQQSRIEAVEFDKEKKQSKIEEVESAKEKQQAELDTMHFEREKQRVELEALKSTQEKQQSKIEAVQSAREKQQAELDTMHFEREKQRAELEALKSDKEQQQAELESLKFDQEQRESRIEAVESAKEKQHAELAALHFHKEKQQAALEALKSAKEKQQSKIEAVESAKEKQQEELEGLTSAKDELERKSLAVSRTTMWVSVSRLAVVLPSPNKAIIPHPSVSHFVPASLRSVPICTLFTIRFIDNCANWRRSAKHECPSLLQIAGGPALRRRVAVTETAQGFLDRAQDRAAGAADLHPVTVSEQREFEALQDEKHREHEERFRELEGEISKVARRKSAAASDHDVAMTVNEHREFEALQNEKHRGHEARFRELEGQISKAARRTGRG